MPCVLITGANRGLGLEFARQYAAEGWSVIGTARDPAMADDFRALGSDVTLLPFDAADDASLAALLRQLGDRPIDILIANSGVDGGRQEAREVTPEAWKEAIGINTYAPFRLAVALRANLERGQHKKLVAVSSLAASIGSGYAVPAQYIYRASKAALNALWRNLSVEWRPLGLIGIMLRPGRVRTRMTDFQGDLSVEESVSGMRRAIAMTTLAESGRFVGFDGVEVPW
jgi:NAD(P)-dependent dehydrogenase (short-subunit alcohol dehydrogenase family)